MQFWELLVLALGLSMDAFAVALCQGLSMPRWLLSRALVLAGLFGVFQAGMPLLGYVLSNTLGAGALAIGPWIACGLLCFIGGKMLWEAFHEDEAATGYSLKIALTLAIATSIDALAAGVTFAVLPVSLWLAVVLIGLTTFALSFAATAIGQHFGARFEKPARIAGGVLLILLGLKMLL